MKTNLYPSFFPAFNQFGNMLDEIFQAVDTAGGQLFNTGLPPANIHETETNFQLELAAPGLNKSDFKIEIENNYLTISCEKKKESEQADKKYSRKEFSYEQFKRSYKLPESVDQENITGNYENGILKLTMVKKTPSSAPNKKIVVE